MNTPINIEIGKLLQEKGFQPKGPIAEYWEVDSRQFLINTWEDEYDTLHHEDSPDDMIFLCAAPTIAQVVMWLYEKHGVWIDVSLNQYSKPKDLQWMYSIVFTQDCTYSHSPKSFNSPTEAYEAAILYTLNNLI